jgi:molybdate transport system substrate-binding protein
MVGAATLTLLSGGAAHGLVQALTPQFQAQTGCAVDGTYSAVGAMRDALVGGALADLVILTAALVAALARDGHVDAATIAELGAVPTCIAVRSGDAAPDIVDGDALRTALRAADGIYFPDPKLATAGIHFARVLADLGIATEVASRLRPFPNGATAMRALAAAAERHPIGCTQATEILATPGTTLVGPLPPGHDLAAVYAVGVCTRAAQPEPARRFAALLTGAASADLRRHLGFVVT